MNLKLNSFFQKLIYLYLITQSTSIIYASDVIDTLDNPSQNFIIVSEIQSDSVYNFIQITNQDGVSIFDTTGFDLTGEFDLTKSQNDRFDLTFGYGNEMFFNISTIRDIKSGFLLSQDRIDCPYETPSASKLQKVTIEIIGLDDYEELRTTMSNKKQAKIIEDENKVTVRGSIASHKDFLISILQKNDNWKSFRVKKSFLKQKNEKDYIISIDIDDFSYSDVHEIEMPIENGTWSAFADVYTTKNEVVTIANWSDQSHFQYGETIFLYTTPDIQIDLLTLNVKNGSLLDGNAYSMKLADIPSFIPNYDPDFEFVEAWHDEYEISIQGTGNLFELKYYFKQDYMISSWKIYQRSESTIKHKIHTLPMEFVQNVPIVKMQIYDPISISGRLFQINDIDFDKIYSSFIFSKYLKCMDYASKSKGIKF